MHARSARSSSAELRTIESPLVRDVRGRGSGRHRDGRARVSARVVEQLLERGILSKDTHGTVVRIAPPLNIEESALEWAVGGDPRDVRRLEQGDGRRSKSTRDCASLGDGPGPRRSRRRALYSVHACARLSLLVVAISSRALFDFEEENRVFDARRPAYRSCSSRASSSPRSRASRIRWCASSSRSTPTGRVASRW